MPEIVEDGVTGFLVDDVDQAEVAVARLESISSQTCATQAATRFSDSVMVERYARLYETIS